MCNSKSQAVVLQRDEDTSLDAKTRDILNFVRTIERKEKRLRDSWTNVYGKFFVSWSHLSKYGTSCLSFLKYYLEFVGIAQLVFANNFAKWNKRQGNFESEFNFERLVIADPSSLSTKALVKWMCFFNLV